MKEALIQKTKIQQYKTKFSVVKSFEILDELCIHGDQKLFHKIRGVIVSIKKKKLYRKTRLQLNLTSS